MRIFLASLYQYEILLMDEDHIYHDQSCAVELAGSSSSEIAYMYSRRHLEYGI